MLKAPFRLPGGWLTTFGYRHGRRFVALFWEPCGDESCFDDGVSSACGLTDNWMFLALVRRPDVGGWLDANGIHLGNSEQPAPHWLVADAVTNDVYAADRRTARTAVVAQRLPAVVAPTDDPA
jgi:hypothetical protein